jgi:hypothetical protein
MSGHAFVKEGTAAASPGTAVSILADAGFTAKQTLIVNTHGTLSLTIAGLPTVNSLTIPAGQSALIPGNVQRFRVIEATATATFQVIASDSSAPSAEIQAVVASAATLADGSVTGAKLAASGTAAAGSIAPALSGFARIPDGANEIELVLPTKCVLGLASVTKTGGVGGAGDEIQIRTATGGGGSLVAQFDLNAVADLTLALTSGIDDSVSTFAAGASVFILGVVGAGDNGGDVTLAFTPVL